jgi:hypothetical protein
MAPAKACLPLSEPEQNVEFSPKHRDTVYKPSLLKMLQGKIPQALSPKAAHALHRPNVDLCKWYIPFRVRYELDKWYTPFKVKYGLDKWYTPFRVRYGLD